MSLNEWIFIGLFFALSWTLPAVPIVLGKILAPRRPNPVKQQVYECGVETYGDTRVQFHAQYYVFALVFLLFDVELVFLFPWAVAYNQLGLFALFEMAVFIFLLVVALVYTWRKGALTWA
ncbi:MAG: NADH-quinone oxidoreductase subunit A [Chloroflexi bacterium]|mgnify:FL=1|nr:NADH-quinone oxidoreductase subunit A [Chloroflexota bacterium]